MGGEGGAGRVFQSGAASGRSRVFQAGRDVIQVAGDLVVGGHDEPKVVPVANRAPGTSGVFVGRDGELARLESAVAGANRVVVAAVHGLGGVGKSTLVARFAEVRGDRFELVWWVTADSPAALDDGLADLAVAVEPALAAAPLDQRVESGIRWLSTHRDWLVVLDNLTSPGDADRLLSRVDMGTVVITSRRGTGWRGLPTVVLDVLRPPEAEELLAEVVRADWPGADLDGAARLCAELGWLPLAVRQAGAYLAQTRITPTDYLALLDRYPARMFAAAGEGEDVQRTMARVWRVTLDRLADTPTAGRVLRELAWYAPENVFRAFLGDDVDVQHALGRLAAYSMIRLDRDAVTVHRLVQAVTRTPDPNDPHRQAEDIAAARDATTTTLSVVQGMDYRLPDHWPVYDAVLTHARSLLGHSAPADDTGWTVALLNSLGLFLQDQGDLTTATAYLARAVDSAERLDGVESQSAVAARNNLARAHMVAGDHEQAIAGHEAALADAVKVLGADHPHTLVARTNLANSYVEAGYLDRGIVLHEEALAECGRVLGADHMSTLEARVNLARGLRRSGDFTRAVATSREAVAESVRVLGENHPSTLTPRNNLALALLDAGAAGEVVRLLAVLERDCERIVGRDHPDTLTCEVNLTAAYRQAGLLRLAVARHHEAVAHVERVLGPGHPLAFAARNDMVTTLLETGGLRRAREFSGETLARARTTFGESHPLTLTAMNNHGLVHQTRGDHAEAVTLLEAARAALERDLGPDHPETLRSRGNLASALWDVGQHERAAAEFHAVIADCARVLGADHPTTLTAQANLRHAVTGGLQAAVDLDPASRWEPVTRLAAGGGGGGCR